MRRLLFETTTAAVMCGALGGSLAAAPQAQSTRGGAPVAANADAAGRPAATPPGYVIGVEDVLGITVWGEERLSGEVVVRPDGRISIALINDVEAAGSTPEDLAQRVATAAARYVETPKVTVTVRATNSQRVFIMGSVGKPDMYPLRANMTVLQLIAVAGGLLEYAESERIQIVRTESNGQSTTLKFNYKDVLARKNLQQNIVLKPGDTVVVP